MRDKVLKGATYRMRTGCGSLYITINEDKEGIPIEVFVRLGKAGGCASCQSEVLGRLITLGLKAGVSLEEIVHQLLGVGCHMPNGFGQEKVLSCADAVARCLRVAAIASVKPQEPPEEESPIREVPTLDHDKILAEVQEIVIARKSGACPDCGAQVAIEEGCEKCYVCGFTKCG
jgi:ribonucleoside-diphosphate reductase alpha chain